VTLYYKNKNYKRYESAFLKEDRSFIEVSWVLYSKTVFGSTPNSFFIFSLSFLRKEEKLVKIKEIKK